MRIPLLKGAYQYRDLLASAQRCINLFPEDNANPQAPVPVTHWPTAGTVLFGQAPIVDNAKVRCTYRTTLGTAYVVIGSKVYVVLINGAMAHIGTIADRPSQVYMADNGLALILVDGVSGWVIELSTNSFAPISDPSFYGADFAIFLDTFFVLNRPNTNQFYWSLSMVTYALLSGTAVESGSITNAGATYTNGTYTNVALTGGTGTGATANITVAGNVVTVVNIVEQGKNYTIGDVLSANAADIGGTGTGFAWTVLTMALSFDPLDIAAKSGNADPIVGIIAVHRELWLVGELTTEIWIGTGSADSYFQQVQGAFIDHGCIAPYSVASQDLSLFWLMQDKQGKNLVVKGAGYDVSEISTPAIVAEFNKYTTTSDAIGYCLQYQDHAFYILAFPTANKTWVYDLKIGQWHEWAWMNTFDGSLNRHRGNCCMFVFGKNIIGDWQYGILWEIDPDTFVDGDPLDPTNNVPIPRIRTFPHLIIDGKAVNYLSFIADMNVGTTEPDVTPQVSLRWSDNRGATYGDSIIQSAGAGGDYIAQIIWNRLGQARDRVFELSWSSAFKTALNGAFVELKKLRN